MAKKPVEVVEEALPETPVKDPRHFVEHSRRGSLRYRNFDEFWFQVARERNLDNSMKQHVRTYFMSVGILADPAKYADGLKSFGL